VGNEFKNPAIGYLASAEVGSSAEDFVLQYADYVLSAIGCCSLPVDLEGLANCFEIKVRKVSLAGQRAVSTADLDIFVEQDDRETVQRYSTAHEVIEFLFHALSQVRPQINRELLADLRDHKETLCEIGAAELLMPMRLFKPIVESMGFKLNTGRYLASLCRVSLTAALRRLLDTHVRKAVIVFFRFGHSSAQYVPSDVGQGNLFGPPNLMDPPKKLRVLRTFTPKYGETGFIPFEKSVGNNTSIFECYRIQSYTSGFDDLDLISVKGKFFVESIPISLDGEHIVLSLLYLE